MGYMDKTLKQTVPYYSTMKRAGAFRQPQKQMAQELRDVAAVLKITEATDTNIRTSMESILRIADRLERKNKGEKRR